MQIGLSTTTYPSIWRPGEPKPLRLQRVRGRPNIGLKPGAAGCFYARNRGLQCPLVAQLIWRYHPDVEKIQRMSTFPVCFFKGLRSERCCARQGIPWCCPPRRTPRNHSCRASIHQTPRPFSDGHIGPLVPPEMVLTCRDMLICWF